MLVIPQDALLMKVRGLFSTLTATTPPATRLAKKVKRAGCWTTEPISRFEYDGGATVPQVAEERKDFEMLQRIKGDVLYACEAQYHRSCRALYIRDPSSWRSSDPEALSQQALMEEAHRQPFEATCAFVEGIFSIKTLSSSLISLRTFTCNN